MSGTVTTTSTASSSGGTQNALASLSSNFQTFLGMLMTQLKNQDPTSPLDTNQFTSELVQFSSVEQQINTNTSLGQLIQLTQNGQMMQSASIVGHKVDVASSTLPLQNGSGTVQFTAASAGPVSITISNAQGSVVGSATVNATQGVNTWNWNGTDSNGATLPDGGYAVAVTAQSSSGTTTTVPFTVIGTATGVQQNGSTLQLQMGALSVNFSALQSIVS